MIENSKIVDSFINTCSKNLSHAYLFITNGDFDFQEIIIKFVIKILFPDKKVALDTLYNQIINNRYSEVKIIKPDGMQIKKEQISELMSEFSKKSLNSSKKVYIINEADKLNDSSANSILKFLEEPNENIIAILTTNCLSGVSETIVSRCQLVNLQSIFEKSSYDIYSVFKEYISKNDYLKDNYGKSFINNVILFIEKIEDSKSKEICFSKQDFHEIFKKREEIQISMQIMLLFYKDVLRHMMNKNTYYFFENIDTIEKIISKNTIQKIVNKIKIINQKKELVKYNVNVSLLIDSLIFDLEGVNL